MVNTKPEAHNQPSEAIYTLTPWLSTQELKELLSEIASTRSMGITDESLRVSGTYAHAERVASIFNHVMANLPKLIETVWSDTRQQELEYHEQVVQTLDDTTDRLLEAARSNAPSHKNIFLTAALTGLGSILLCHFILFPAELRLARVGDGEVMEWLATPDGKLLKAAFKSGNTSVEACVKRAGSHNHRQKEKGSIFCEIQIKK